MVPSPTKSNICHLRKHMLGMCRVFRCLSFFPTLVLKGLGSLGVCVLGGGGSWVPCVFAGVFVLLFSVVVFGVLSACTLVLLEAMCRFCSDTCSHIVRSTVIWKRRFNLIPFITWPIWFCFSQVGGIHHSCAANLLYRISLIASVGEAACSTVSSRFSFRFAMFVEDSCMLTLTNPDFCLHLLPFRIEVLGTPLCLRSAWLRQFCRLSSCCILSVTPSPSSPVLFWPR